MRRPKTTSIINVLPIFLCLVFVVIVTLLFIFGCVPLLTFGGAIVALVVTAVVSWASYIMRKKQLILVGFTSKYLLDKEESYLDEILGILISGKWKKLKLDPIEEFFNSLKKLSLKSDFEMRRRITEALPALFEMDLEKSKELVGNLRKDWDERWKSDNRRRTIEALHHIIKKERDFVAQNLHIIEDDEIFTILAIVEVLDAWREKVNAEEAEGLFGRLRNEMKEKGCEPNELEAVLALWELLSIIHLFPERAVKIFEDKKDSENCYIQICIARNLKHIHSMFPEKMLNLMDHFIQRDMPKNVRRPIAKEDSVECLTILLNHRKHCEQAKEIIWKLINDEDEIIQLATFDKIEKIIEIDNDYGKKILNHVIQKNSLPKLVERAKTLSARS